MAEIKLNKTELKIQKSLLDQLVKFLPTLQLKKQQLQGEVELVRTNVEKLNNEIDTLRKEIEPWAVLLSQHLTSSVEELVVLEEIISERENIAGVDVPVFKEVIFKNIKY